LGENDTIQVNNTHNNNNNKGKRATILFKP